MRNELLENLILKNLRRVDCGLREKTLMAAVSLEMDREDLTTAEFEDAIRNLETAECVTRWSNVLGMRFWGITTIGKAALEGK